MNFTGDAETIRFKKILATVLEKNELGGLSPYALYFATKDSNGGWSFGVSQYDLSTCDEKYKDLFKNILLNATEIKEVNGENKEVYIIGTGDPSTGRSSDIKVTSLLEKANKKSSTSLSEEEKGLIDKALSSMTGSGLAMQHC